MEEEAKAIKATLQTELDAMEKVQSDAKAAEARLRAERVVEEQRRSSLYQKLKSVETRASTGLLSLSPSTTMLSSISSSKLEGVKEEEPRI